MRAPAAAACAGLALLLAGCGGEDDQGIAQTPARTNTQTTRTSTTEEGSQVRVVLNEQDGSGITGTATLSRAGGDTTTSIDLELRGASATHPAHIHAGTCDELEPTPKVPLQEARGGRSRTDADIDLQTLLAGSHSINVHRSPQKLEEYVACGEIVSSQG